MKAAIISSATLAKYGRWDPKFYLGNTDESEKIKRYQKRIDKELARIEQLKEKQKQEAARIEQMIREGEIKPLTDGGSDGSDIQ